ncbi:hypothetical protein TrRE_jg6772 [Triparma retinervis]|uniref:DNA repair protein Crb2 Tudor domain-containing protein n=1 Tax=Triparma retinervis TaxID=2557542 RepID=A0A9W7G5N2_9STRA|nr:hypothetical protein TrRE_jg6772 [Triparma retinervis]
MSLRFGGTHCHASGLVHFHECSSLNSVLFYCPWVYVGITGAKRLIHKNSWAFPFIAGTLFFGMCGVYESQGPMMGWWLWPKPDMMVKAGCDIWQNGDLNDDTRGLVSSKHAYDALFTRVHGCPALAPYFHFAFGWGIAKAYQLTSFKGNPVLLAFIGPAIGMIWDPPVRVLVNLFGIDQTGAAVAIMMIGILLPLIVGPNLKVFDKASADYLLFSIPLINSMFFAYNAVFGFGKEVIPPNLTIFVVTLCLAAVLFYGRAFSVIGTSPKPQRVDPRYKGNGGWLDRLQKDAHASELDHTNTPPYFFVFLTIIQPPACVAIAKACGVGFEFAFLPILSHTIMFFVSHYILGTCKYFDMTGEITFFPLIVYSHVTYASGAPSHVLTTALALVWCTRLGIFLGWRIMKRGSDWRFDKLMKAPAYNCFGWVSQGTWIFLQGMCVWKSHVGEGFELNTLMFVGVVVWAVGLFFEHTADMQKTRWNASIRSGQQRAWISEGLWYYSRHPNFFGEMTNWLGLWLASSTGLIGFVSPFWSWFFLVFTSLMLLEKRIDKKFEGRDDYEKYKSTTNVLVPWFKPGKKKATKPSVPKAKSAKRGSSRGPSKSASKVSSPMAKVSTPRKKPASREASPKVTSRSSSRGPSKSASKSKSKSKFKAGDTRSLIKYEKGDRVEALYMGEGKAMYPGTVVRAKGGGFYDVKFDDGDRDKDVDPYNMQRLT